MARIKYRSTEAREIRRRFIKRMLLVLFVFLILIITGAIFLLRMKSIQIQEVNIEGSNIINKNDIQKVVDDSLSGNYFWVIPKSNTFLYSLSRLNKELIKKFPGIYTLNISRENLSKISIKMVERKPEALWCQDNGDEALPWCFFVDSTGIVFAESPYFTGNVYFIYYGKLNKDEPLGAQIFNSTDFHDLELFIKQVGSKLGLSIIGADLKGEKDFDLLLSSGARIMLNKNISYEDMYNNMDAVLKSQQVSSSTLDSIDYIDMRFGNKIYYKKKPLAPVSVGSGL